MNDNESLISMSLSTEEYPLGAHMCYIYNDDVEHRQVVSKFLEGAILQGERAVCVADKATESEVAAYLEDIGVEMPKVSREDQIATLCACNFYYPGGAFSPERAVNSVRTVKEESQVAGYSGVRFASEMDWALRENLGSERVIEYEVRLNMVRKTYRSIGMCQYDARRFDGATLFDILRVHPMMIVRGQIIHNPYYVEPEEFLRQRAGA